MRKGTRHTMRIIPFRHCCWILAAWFLMVTLAPRTSGAAEARPGIDYPLTFRYGVLRLLDRVNQKDAQVVIEMDFVRNHQQQFPNISAKLEVVPDKSTAAEMFRRNQLHGIALSGMDYVILKEQVPLVPLFISSRQDTPLEAHLLLTSQQVTSLEQLAALPQRRLIYEHYGETAIGRMWLDTILVKNGLPASDSFFTSLQSADKPTRMILPVFFGQAEACLVPESVYKTMLELNPQVGSKLGVLLRSPGFVRSINCAAQSFSPMMQAAMKRNAMEMSEKAEGQQLMLVFQYKRHYLFDPKYIESTEEIYRVHRAQADDIRRRP